MEVQVVNLLQEKEEILSFDEGMNWLVTSDESTWNDLERLQVFINDLNFQSKFHLLVLESSEEIKSKIQSSNQLTYFLSPSSKTQLKIESVPWYTCIKTQAILYSSSEFPSNLDFLPRNEDDLTELKSPEKALKAVLSSVSPELPNTSQLISKDIDQELSRAHEKISKLRLRVSQQEQTIEDYKVEIKMLKAQLSGKSVSKVPEKDRQRGENAYLRKDFSESSKGIKKKFFSQVDDSEFWKIDENEQFQESLRLDDKAVAKDLWLMGLIMNSPVESKDMASFHKLERSSEKSSQLPLPKDLRHSKNLKAPGPLPPIQADKRKDSRSVQRESSGLSRNPRIPSKNPRLSNSRLVKG